MKKQDRALAEKILDYWFALEFFSQDQFPEHRDIENRIKKHKQKAAQGGKPKDVIENFMLLRGSGNRESLYDIISREAAACAIRQMLHSGLPGTGGKRESPSI